jgi:hypothetical protein
MADPFFPEVPVNQRATALGLEIMPATFGEGFGAAFEETLTRNPIPSAFRATARARYRDGAYVDEFGNEQTAGRLPSNILSSEEASSKYGLQGRLKFDAPTPEPIAESLYRLKVRELELQDTKRRANAGLGTALTAGILGSLLDPLNVALAFVPIVGPARQTALAARLGVGGGRAATGAIEGAVGAAIIEPLVLGVAREEQADYTAVDSLANIVFGTAIGGGLHFSAGYIGDRFKARAEAGPLARTIDSLPQQDQAALLRTAVAQALEGRSIDVRAAYETLRAYHGTTSDFTTPYNNGEGIGPHFGTQQQANAFATGEGANVRPVELDFQNPIRLPDGSWENPAGIALKLHEAKVITEDQLGEFGKPVDALMRQYGGFKNIPDAELKKAHQEQFQWLRDRLMEKGHDSIVYANEMAGEGVGDSYIALNPGAQVRSVFTPALKEAVAKAQEPHVDKADSDGIAAADQRVADEANVKTIDDEATRMQEEVTELEAYSPEGIEPSQAVKDAAKEASLYARAWKAAAACGMRKA